MTWTETKNLIKVNQGVVQWNKIAVWSTVIFDIALQLTVQDLITMYQ